MLESSQSSAVATPTIRALSPVILVAGIIGGLLLVGAVLPTVSSIAIPFFGPEEIVTVREGAYDLVGSSPGATAGEFYQGTVFIRGYNGIYDLTWQIGDQIQSGVGVANNGVLSVSYVDTSGEIINDIGVVSYRITSDGLSGIWVSQFGGGAIGWESLTWNPLTHEDLEPAVVSEVPVSE